VEGIKRGVENLSAIIYMKPPNSNNNSALGKRNFLDLNSPGKQPTSSSEYTFNRLSSQIDEIADTNPVQTAWMIHQVTTNDNDFNIYGSEEEVFDEGNNNVPLHIACGYLDDILSAYPDLLGDNNFSGDDHFTQSAVRATTGGGASSSFLRPARSSLPDLESFGAWPYNTMEQPNHHTIVSSPPLMYCQPTSGTLRAGGVIGNEMGGGHGSLLDDFPVMNKRVKN
jgi:hypothetical protein